MRGRCGGHGQATWLRPPYTGGMPPPQKPFQFFYLLLLGPAGQVQAEKEQVRGKIKQFLGGASPSKPPQRARLSDQLFAFPLPPWGERGKEKEEWGLRGRIS